MKELSYPAVAMSSVTGQVLAGTRIIAPRVAYILQVVYPRDGSGASLHFFLSRLVALVRQHRTIVLPGVSQS